MPRASSRLMARPSPVPKVWTCTTSGRWPRSQAWNRSAPRTVTSELEIRLHTAALPGADYDRIVFFHIAHEGLPMLCEIR